MSEALLSAAEKPLSAGAMLRKAREAAGMHIGALAVSLRVPVKKIEALEADRFDALPDLVFVRALAASVCRVLNIDPVPILASIPQTGAPQFKNDEAGINVTIRGTASTSGTVFWDPRSRPLVLLGIVLLIGVLALAVLNHFDRIPALITSKPVVEAAAPVLVTPPVAVSPASAGPAADAASASASAPGVTVEGAGLSTGTLVFKVRGASWVEVLDANGVVQLRKMLHEGETTGVSGAMPLSVVIGRADVTEVQVLGKPFDLTPMTKDNVARFEVKP